MTGLVISEYMVHNHAAPQCDGGGRAMASNNTERYRKRAEELRVIADGMPNPTAKQIVLDCAASFEQIAESAKHLGPRSPLFRDL